MSENTVAEFAAEHGWSVDSDWTPSFVNEQISTVVDGLLLSVKTMKDATIRWGVTPLDPGNGESRKGQHGGAASLEQAVQFARDAAAARQSTLFTLQGA